MREKFNRKKPTRKKRAPVGAAASARRAGKGVSFEMEASPTPPSPAIETDSMAGEGALREEWLEITCPYCEEEFEVHVTSEEDGQTKYERCQVCCRPISMLVRAEDGELQIETYRS